MNENDKRLISDLADRLQRDQSLNKDPEAAQYIEQHIMSKPEPIYRLVQAYCIHKQAIEQLQQQVYELQSQLNSKKGFFSSLMGNRNSAPPPPPYYANPPQNAFGQNSFLKSALGTAAGVAGGMFLFEGLQHLFSGESAQSAQGSMLDNAMTADPFTGQDQLLNDGFGTGDSFLNDNSSDFGSDAFGGGFDSGFGDDGDFSNF